MKFTALALTLFAAATASAAAVEQRQNSPIPDQPIGSEMHCYDGGQEWADKNEAKFMVQEWCLAKFPRDITTGNQIKSCYITPNQHYMLRMAAEGQAYTPFSMTPQMCVDYMNMVVDSCARGGEVRGPLENAWMPRYVQNLLLPSLRRVCGQEC